MIACSSTPAIRRLAQAPLDVAPASTAVVEERLEQLDEWQEGPGRFLRVVGEQLLDELGHGRARAALLGCLRLRGGLANPVVLDEEAVQPFSGTSDCEVTRRGVGRRSDRLLDRASSSSCLPAKYW